jgi:hypothetical protein
MRNYLLEKCLWCGKAVEKTVLGGFCRPQCELAYRKTDPSSKLSKDNKFIYGVKTCSACSRSYVGYKNHNEACSPACKPNVKKVSQKKVQLSRWEILKRDSFKCLYCGRSSRDGFQLEIDHIIPASKGGRPTADNVTACCDLCNFHKAAEALPLEVIGQFRDCIRERNEACKIGDKAWVNLSTRFYKHHMVDDNQLRKNNE